MSDPEQLDLLDWLAAQPLDPAPGVPAVEPAFTPTSPVAPVHLTRVDSSCNMRRFYSVALTTSLFGERGVMRNWGRIGTSGQNRTDWYKEHVEAESALQTLLRAKRRRGYMFWSNASDR